MYSRAGVTLVELMVVLAVLGVMASVVLLSWPPDRSRPAGQAPATDSIAVLRHRALQSGRPVAGVVTIGGFKSAIIALPDGRIVGPERLGVSPLTGRKIDAQAPAR